MIQTRLTLSAVECLMEGCCACACPVVWNQVVRCRSLVGRRLDAVRAVHRNADTRQMGASVYTCVICIGSMITTERQL